MNPTTHFELLPTSNEFETASEEFERSFGHHGGGRGGRSGSSLSRRQQQRQQQQQQRRSAHGYSRSSYGYGPSYDPAPWPAWGGTRYQRCVQQCVAAPYSPPYPPAYPQPLPGPAPDAAGPDPGPVPDAPSEELGNGHPHRCRCPQCSGAQPGFGFGLGTGSAAPFSEAEEVALAAELLSVSNEAELEQFLGKLWSGVKKVAGTVGTLAKPFTGVLRSVAKQALPFVGGALGSMIPIPGVGTALGTALGSAVSSALEMEFEGLELEDREFEMARRFVRIAGTAAQQAVDGAAPAELEAAVAAAAQQHLPHFRGTGQHLGGRWTRRGSVLVLHGVS